jgi:hypothetical protein
MRSSPCEYEAVVIVASIGRSTKLDVKEAQEDSEAVAA